MLASLFLALSLATLPVGWNYNVTECINSSGVPVRSLHEGDHFAILGSGFGATVGSVTHCWGKDGVLQWSDTRIDAVAGQVWPGMESGEAPLVVLPADGTHCLSAFRVKLISVTVRALPGAARHKAARKAPNGLPADLLRFYRGL
jgi:hypothetical protein